METKLINLDNILAISCNLCNKRWNSAKGSCRKQRVYFCPIQPNTCSDLHYNSLKLFTCSQSKHFSNMAGNEQRWDGASPHSLSNFTILTHSVEVICLTRYQKIFCYERSNFHYLSEHNWCKQIVWSDAKFDLEKWLKKPKQKRTWKNNFKVLISFKFVQPLRYYSI